MKKKLSIKNKITISITGVILIFGAAAAAAVFFMSKQDFIAIKKDDIKLQTIEQAHETGQVFTNSKRLIESGALEPDIIAYTKNGMQVKDEAIFMMLNHYNIGKIFDPIYILNKEGVAIASTDPLLLGNTYAFRDYYKQSIGGNTFVEANVGVTTRRAGYYFSSPISDVDGSVVGVLVGKVTGGDIEKSLLESVLVTDGRIMFTDADGIVFYSNVVDRIHKSIGPLSAEKKKEILDSRRLADIPIVELQYNQVMDAIRTYSAPINLDFYDPVDKENEIVSVVRVPGTAFFLILEEETDMLAAPALTISIVLSIAVLLAALFAAILVYFLSARFLRPLELLRNAANKISEGDYSYRADIATGDEFEDVAVAFGEMAEKVKASYESLNQRVVEKTVALTSEVEEIEKKNKTLQDTQRAVMNVLDDSHVLESNLEQERDRLRGILASMGEGLFVYDKNFRIIMVNALTERILGVPLNLIEGASILELIAAYKGKTPIPTAERPIVKTISEGKDMHIDIKDDLYWNITGGRRFPVGFIATPLTAGGIVGGVIIFRDLSREKNLDEARTSFISITSHQLRTPLTSLKWFLEMLMDGSYATPLTAEQKNFADLAYQAADRMMGIINLLLQIARVEAGRVKVLPVVTDLRQFTQNVVTSFGNSFDLKKQKIEIITTPDPLPQIMIDADIFGQVMQNLMSNANRYALEGTTITVGFKVEGDKVICSVTDKGIGIKKAEATRIFEKFFRAENALRLVPEGSGLGLSLVKSLVEGWGGTIWFESEEWKGTTFFFTLPLAGMTAREGEVGIRVT